MCPRTKKQTQTKEERKEESYLNYTTIKNTLPVSLLFTFHHKITTHT